MTAAQQATRLYSTSNLKCARIVAADPERYPGVMQEWAAIIIERQQPTVRGPLFQATRQAA